MSERNDTAGIPLYFCALCNESIPRAEVDSGRAQRHKERWVCSTCERAMSGAPSETQATNAAPSPGSDPHADPRLGAGRARRESSGVGVALMALLAMCLAVGAVLWTRWQREQDLAELARREAAEAARVDAALASARKQSADAEGEARRAFEDGLRAARAEWHGAEQTLRDEAHERTTAAQRDLEDLRGELTTLTERLASAATTDDLAPLRASTASVEERLAALTKQVGELAERLARPVVAASPTEPAAPAQPTWFGLVQRLKSPNYSERWGAVDELGETRDPAVVDYLLPLLQDPDVFVRLKTAEVLGNLGSLSAVDWLIGALGDEDSSVADNAYVALRKLTKKDLPFDAQSPDAAERQRRIKAWADWWKKARESGSTS